MFQNLHATERPKSLEYHVNKPTPVITRKEAKIVSKTNSIEPKIEQTDNNKTNSEKSYDNKSPEEEIDNAFEIIDKS